jgi:hypothetical protein
LAKRCQPALKKSGIVAECLFAGSRQALRAVVAEVVLAAAADRACGELSAPASTPGALNSDICLPGLKKSALLS